MANSPIDIEDPTLRFTISIEGTVIQAKYPVVSIRIHHETDRISTAEIELEDGIDGDGGDAGTLPGSEGTDFIPGNEVIITAGYGDDTEVQIFKGLIVKQAVRVDSYTAFRLVVTCKHAAVKMTYNKKEAEFADSTDSDTMTKLISSYGLSATVESTSAQQEMLFQKMGTDWDFLLARAAFNGFITTLGDGKVTVGKPQFTTDAVLRIAMGESIISFNAELNAEKQAPSLEVAAWDPQTLALITSSATEPSLNAHGNMTAQTLSSKLDQKALQLISSAPLAQADLKNWADSRLLRMRMSALHGSVSFIGNASVTPDSIIELSGVGERFNGKAYVSAVTHELSSSWTTTVKFGLADKPIYEKSSFSETPANGQMPAIHGLQLATVSKISEDPGATYRIQVKPASNASDAPGIWARLASYYATGSAGAVFCPEVGDEVILGFLESDPRYPVVLGSLFSKSKTPPLTQGDEKNNTKALYTRSQLQISFDDDKKVILITTPGKNKITISDDAKQIEILDQQNNSIKLNDSGITLNSAKDITIKATGNIDMQATGKVSIKATQDLEMNGMNIKQTASMALTAKGTASAELSASGQTVVKGGMVMIN
jgi:Rhs element Vgr protein